MADAYLRSVRNDSNGDIAKITVSGTPAGKVTDVKRKPSVVRDIDSGEMTYATAVKVDGEFVVGDEVHTVENKYIRTDGNEIPQDNLGDLPNF